MSYVLEESVCIPENIEIKVNNHIIVVKGQHGVLSLKLHDSLEHQKIDNKLVFSLKTARKREFLNNKPLLGTVCALLHSMIIGVNKKFEKKLQLVGVGYRAMVDHNTLILSVGFSHIINYRLPDDISVVCPTSVEIILCGINKQLVGQVAANLRNIRPPEAFKGKGIRYMNEVLYTKEVKKSK